MPILRAALLQVRAALRLYAEKRGKL